MKITNNTVLVACPPLKDFPDAPKDQSECTLTDCPDCKDKMWLSQKKKGVLLFASLVNKDIFLRCYTCFKKCVQENRSKFSDLTIQEL